jgi:hypothetical protein
MAKRDLRQKLLAEADKLRPWEELLRTKGFIAWRAHIEAELALLENWSWNPVKESDTIRLQKAFSELGLVPPKAREDLLNCFMSFRGARNYVKAKFEWLDQQVAQFAAKQEQLSRLSKTEET